MSYTDSPPTATHRERCHHNLHRQRLGAPCTSLDNSNVLKPRVLIFPHIKGELNQTTLKTNTLIIQPLFSAWERDSSPKYLPCVQIGTHAYSLVFCRYANVTATNFVSQNIGKRIVPSQFLNLSLWVLQAPGVFPMCVFMFPAHFPLTSLLLQSPMTDKLILCNSFLANVLGEHTNLPQLFCPLLPTPKQQGTN